MTATDFLAENGVIHVLDKVSWTLSIAGHAVANPAFSSLAAAVTKAGLADALADSGIKYTVFAYKPIINIENHDTIGMIALDSAGNLSGACTTSGLAYKMHGRVGDSPIIGAGLFVDNEVGAATATGMGEAVLKTCGTFLVVELMRQGRSPEEACREAVLRIAKKQNYNDFQIGFLALDKQGNTGAYCIHPGFSYALHNGNGAELIPARSYTEK